MSALRHGPFRLLVAGRAVNALGGSFTNVALAFAVLDLTGSATDLGLVIAARTICSVVLLLFGGVLADRLPKHLLMVGSSVVAGLSQAAAATVVLTHTATIPVLMALAAINGLAAAMSMPASSAILPRLVPERERQQANALNRLSYSTAQIVGAPVAGVVVAAVGAGWGLAVDSLTFVLAAVCFALVRVPRASATPPSERSSPERSHLIADLRTGWSEFWSRQWLWVVVVGFCVINAAWSGGLLVLGPTIAADSFGSRGWGLVLASETAGLIVGGLIAMRLRLRRMLFFGVVACLFMVPPIFALGVHPALWLLMPLMFLCGLMLEQFGVAWETTMQEHIPAGKLARVYSYDMVGSFVAMPIGEVLAGPAAHAVGLETAETGLAVVMLVAVLGMLSSRGVRSLPHKLAERSAGPVKESVA